MAPSAPPSAVTLSALAALLPRLLPAEDPGGSRSPALGTLLSELSSPQGAAAADALKDFEASGLRCLEALSPEARDSLQGLAGAGNAARAARAADWPTNTEVNSVKLMFDKFDSDGDGLISRAQFKDVLLQLGLGEDLSEEELETLVGVADQEGKNFINLQEFTEWLYSTGSRQLATGSADEEQEFVSHTEKVEGKLRSQLCQTREALQAAEAQLAEAERTIATAVQAAEAKAARALAKAEDDFEKEMEETLNFWRSVAQTSACPKLGQALDLSTAELLGNGKYGYVFKSKRLETGQTIVIKLLSIRWAHVAAKEWQQARKVGSHPNIVDYQEAMLHADDDKCIAELLKSNQDQGKLNARTKKANFPDRYICLTEEYMNRGTVQDWIDKELLLPGGMLVVMQRVASALAFMHKQGVTHNDVKPENVLLQQDDEANPRAEVIVKLADLGLATVSMDRTADFQLYGMTVFCMTTGEKFGSRKILPNTVVELVCEVAELTGDDRSKAPPGVGTALAEVPGLLRGVWCQAISMADVRDASALQGWNFFDGEPPAEAEVPVSPVKTPQAAKVVGMAPLALSRGKPVDGDKVLDFALASSRRAQESVRGTKRALESAEA